MTVLANSAALAQSQQRAYRLSPQQEAARDRLNAITLLVATSHPTTSYFAMAHDIATITAKKGDIRVLPMPSEGGIDTLRDLVFLRGVDMAIVPANALESAKAGEMFGPGLTQRLAFVSRLHNEEVHLLVGPNTKTVTQLSGKKVAVPPNDGTAFFTAQDLFSRLNVGVEIVRVPVAEALDRVRSGELTAALMMGPKPLSFLADIPRDGSIQLLALPASPALEDAYLPAAFRTEDYPTLIPGGLVESVAVNAVLMAHNARGSEESSYRMAKFIPAFFEAMSERPVLNRYAKWEVNLAATLPGWSRLPAAEEWLRRAQQEQALSLRRSFEEFLREKQPPGSPALTAAQRKKLFDEFVSWTRKSVSETGESARR